MKTMKWIWRYSFFYLAILILLLPACQMATEPGEPLPPTPIPVTEVAVTSTPAETATVEPTPSAPPPTADISPGQTTPPAPSDSGNQIGWVMSGTAILRTTNGGESWEDVTPAGIHELVRGDNGSLRARLAGGFSQGDSALVAFAQGYQAEIYRTSDGGQNWQVALLQLQDEVQGLTSIVLLNEKHAWLLATRGVGAGNDWVDLYYSGDGGESWGFLTGSESENNPAGGISSGGLKSGISFNSPQVGWLTGSAPIEMVYLFRTLDGGQTWQPYHLPLPEGASFSGSSFPPIFFDEQTGILPVTVITLSNEAGLLFYETQDAGESWLPVVLLEGELTAWDWLDEQHGFAAGTEDQLHSKLFITQDGGRSWDAYPAQMAVVSHLDFISEEEGWALCGWAFNPREGCSEDVYHTQDGGLNWERVYP
jgi:photosystem II stability/assembly factor-like uncharacterized protein